MDTRDVPGDGGHDTDEPEGTPEGSSGDSTEGASTGEPSPGQPSASKARAQGKAPGKAQKKTAKKVSKKTSKNGTAPPDTELAEPASSASKPESKPESKAEGEPSPKASRATGADGDLAGLPDLPGLPVDGEFDERAPVDDEIAEALDDDLADDEFDEGEDDDSGEEESEAEEGGEGDGSRRPAVKKRKPPEEEEEVANPDTPVPTDKKMLAALEKAFEGQDDVDAALLTRFAQHALALLETNRVMNLTAIVDPYEVAVKHYLDSWRITRVVPLMARQVLDLGSGGGFPGIPIALAEPMCSVILCESITKKAKFLEEVVAKLGLRNVRVVNERAEEFLVRERVDVVVVRAVSSVRENIRTLRKVRHSMHDLVLYKGSSWGREVRAAEREAERLGFKLDTVVEHDLPDDMGRHAILIYRAPGGAGY